MLILDCVKKKKKIVQGTKMGWAIAYFQPCVDTEALVSPQGFGQLSLVCVVTQIFVSR